MRDACHTFGPARDLYPVFPEHGRGRLIDSTKDLTNNKESNVIVDIYESITCTSQFLAIEAGADPSSLDADVLGDSDLDNLRLFKMGVSLVPGWQLIGLDPDDIMDQVNAKGYATFTAKVIGTP